MNGPVSSETGVRASFRNAVELCAFVDRLSPDDVGELRVARNEGDVCGAVFIERGRVCWAAARGLAPRLSHLLGEVARVPPNEMEALVLRCRREKKGLGAVFAELGVVGSDDLRRSMLQHSVESLDALCERESVGAWRARVSGFGSPFSFDTAELLTRSVAHAHADHVESSARAMAAFTSLRTGEWGAAFLRLRSLATPLPIAVVGDWPQRSRTLMKVGKWAASTMDISKMFQSEDALVTTIEGKESGGLLAWRHEELLVVGRLFSQAPARILNYRATARRWELSAQTARRE